MLEVAFIFSHSEKGNHFLLQTSLLVEMEWEHPQYASCPTILLKGCYQLLVCQLLKDRLKLSASNFCFSETAIEEAREANTLLFPQQEKW